jgi:hypothetical protein
MITIEISNVENVDRKVLRETAAYLMALSGAAPKEETACDMTFGDFEREKDFHPAVPHDEFFSPPSADSTNKFHSEPKLTQCIPEGFENEPGYPAPSPTDIFKLASVELDTDGLPWDLRIHARTKTKTADGRWKKLRGIGPVTVQEVEAELRRVQLIPSPAVTPVAPVPAPAVTPVAPVPAPVPPVPAAPDFTDLMSLITSAITAGKLRREIVAEVLQKVGIPSLPVIASRPDLIPGVLTSLTEIVNASC